MCYSDCDSIILIIVPDIFFYLHEDVEHPCDGLFVGAAVAGGRTLHFAGRVFKDFDARTLRGIDERAAHLGDLHRRLLVV